MFRLALAGALLLFLAASAPHQVHHVGAQLHALLAGARAAEIPAGPGEEERAGEREGSPYSPPAPAQTPCVLQVAGQLGWCDAATPPALPWVEVWTPVAFQSSSFTTFRLPDAFPIRAPPLAFL